MKSALDLERLAERIAFFVRENEMKEAVDALRRLVNYSLSDAFDEVEKRAEAAMLKDRQLEGKHYAALKSLRAELGIERKIGSSSCGPKG